MTGVSGTYADGFSVAKSALGSLSEYKTVKVYVDLDGDFKKDTDPHGTLSLSDGEEKNFYQGYSGWRYSKD